MDTEQSLPPTHQPMVLQSGVTVNIDTPVAITKSDAWSDVASETAEHVVGDLVAVHLLSEMIKSKLEARLAIKVTPAIIVLLSTIEREQNFFNNELIVLLREIVKDGVVNAQDIPLLITLFDRLLTLISHPINIKIDNLPELCLQIIHLLLEIVLEQKLIPGLSPELIVTIDAILKSCVSVASKIHNNKKVKSFFSRCMR